MSVFKPPAVWWRKPLDAEEKVWIGLALVWCIVMFAMMIVWAVAGKQNPPRETYRVRPADAQRRAAEFATRFQRKDASGRPAFENGVPVVTAPETEDAYMIGRTWAWEPILVLRKGRTYRVRLTSLDLQHGFSLQPTNLNLTVLPGYEQVVNLTPTETGEFLVVCNEYCGMGHHQMAGKIIVTD